MIDGERYRAAAQANQVRLIPVAAPRGMIYDRHGTVIARSRPSFVVASDSVGSYRRHARTRDAGADARRRRSAAVEPPAPSSRDRTIPASTRSSRTNRTARSCWRRIFRWRRSRGFPKCLTDLPGVDLEVRADSRLSARPERHRTSSGTSARSRKQEYERLQARAATRPTTSIGKDGLEYAYDTYLRGTPGGQRVVVDAPARSSPNVKLASKAAVPGDTLVTNLDWRLAAHRRATRSPTGSRGIGRRTLSGAVVAEDPWTGAILALASYPNYDPNDFAIEPLKARDVRSHRRRASRSSIARSPPRRRPGRRSKW